MNETFALRILPWHALQNRLAAAIASEPGALANLLHLSAPAAQTSCGLEGKSWLVRALLSTRVVG